MKVKDIRNNLASAATMIIYTTKSKQDAINGNYSKLGFMTFLHDDRIPQFIDDLEVLMIYPNKKGEQLEVVAKYDEE